ncbi:hypothetical protein KP509_19G008600 [Ceratopteris richardii]|nr:hypothetical protein KP509_19G008600 [Ceratopteris richardii]KAH7351663.1 hypothetical protein KP509_19G008600 [Ceratopteris richardii]
MDERGNCSPIQQICDHDEEVFSIENGHAQEIPYLFPLVREGEESCTCDCKQSLNKNEEKIAKYSVESLPRRRLASLDVFRGLTIAAMILVDDAGGSWPSINHSPWHGVTFADFVMPFFLFIVGMSLVLSFKNINDKFDAFEKASLRALKLFALGVFLQGGYFHGSNDLSFGVDMKHLRIMGILQRISIAYFLVSCCEIFAKRSQISRREFPCFKVDAIKLITMYPWHWVFGLAVSSVYLGLLFGLIVPDWYFETDISKNLISNMGSNVRTVKINCDMRGDLGPACNAVGYLDRIILGINHLYRNPVYRRTQECSINSPDYGPPPPNAPAWCFAPFDPEGVLSSFMASVSCLIGAHYGHALLHFKNDKRRLYEWVAFGMFLNALGLFIKWLGMPLNKPLYTISYVCVTGGTAGLLFSALYTVVDVLKYRKPFILLEWMGMNALLIFVLAAVEVFPALVRGFYWSSPQKNL